MTSNLGKGCKTLPYARVRRHQCKFIRSWLSQSEFRRWLGPVRGDDHKAHCSLCDKAFSVAHGGFHDVRAHWKGKRHLGLEALLSAGRSSGLVGRQRLADQLADRNSPDSDRLGRSSPLGRFELGDASGPCEQVMDPQNALPLSRDPADVRRGRSRNQKSLMELILRTSIVLREEPLLLRKKGMWLSQRWVFPAIAVL